MTTENENMDPTNGINSGNDTTAGKGAPKKPEFDVFSAKDNNGNSIVNADGKITGVPVNVDLSHALISVKAFAKASDFYRYKAFLCGLRAEALLEKQRDFETEAIMADNPDSPQAKISKIEKLKAQLAKLEESLAESGLI